MTIRSNGLVLSLVLGAAALTSSASLAHPRHSVPSPFDAARGLVLRGTVVTMDDAHSVIEHGNVLVRDDRVLAVWRGNRPPSGTPVGDAITVDLGPSALIFPGMINLHNHPTYNVLSVWPAPASHTQPSAGRPAGTEPYGNRYQWNAVGVTSPAEYRRG